MKRSDDNDEDSMPAYFTSQPSTLESEARCPTCTSSCRTIKAGIAYGVLEPGACPDDWHSDAAQRAEAAGYAKGVEDAAKIIDALTLGFPTTFSEMCLESLRKLAAKGQTETK